MQALKLVLTMTDFGDCDGYKVKMIVGVLAIDKENTIKKVDFFCDLALKGCMSSIGIS